MGIKNWGNRLHLGGRSQLSVLLAVVLFATQFATLTHNAEYGRNHLHHDHHQHDHHDDHQSDSPTFSFAAIKTLDREPTKEPNNELCEFVLQADRSSAADVPDVQTSVSLEFSESHYGCSHHNSDYTLHVTSAHARAPPTPA